jgi:hypothetical protein
LHPGDVSCSPERRRENAKAVLPEGAGTASGCKNYCFFSFSGSLAGALEPAAALPLLLGALVVPPAAESFFSASADAEELEEVDGGVLGVALEAALEELWSFFDMSTEAEPEVELEGALGVVVEPAEEEAEPDGGVVRETARSPASLSQPVSNPAPSARDTATAKVESLMCGPPWLGYDRCSKLRACLCIKFSPPPSSAVIRSPIG